jgi:dTDP-glucose 4,6-dehydratase
VKNILITGVLGHLGSKFAKLLLDNFPMYNVFGIDNEADKKYINNKELFNSYDKFDYIKGDITNTELISNILTERKSSLSTYYTNKGVDYIFNFAFNSLIADKKNLGISYIRDNISGVLNIAIEALKHWDGNYTGKRLIYISALDVFRFTEEEKCYDENSHPNPDTISGSIKLSVEAILKTLNERFGIPITIIRTPFLVGRYNGIYPILPNIFASIKNNERVVIDFHPETTINIGHIEDILIAIESTFKDKSNFTIYNACGHNVSIKKIVDTFAEFVKTDSSKVIYEGKNKLNLCVMPDKIYNNLGWKHFTDLEITLKKVADEI